MALARWTTCALAASVVALVACNSGRKTEGATADQACTRCHGGGDNQTGAPPVDVDRQSDTTRISVGAHTSHLSARHGLSAPLPCEACHPVPAQTKSPGHGDGTVQVVFGPLASKGDVTPSWDRAAATCTVYCHGPSLTGGTATAPLWTKVDGTQVACGGCHRAPPDRPHPQRVDCRTCHPATVTEGGGFTAAHVDGTTQVDWAALGCSDCHGDPTRDGSALVKAAPPVGTHGELETSTVAVGAHQAHVVAGRISAPLACESCHVVPSDPSHPDDVVEIAFHGIAVTDGAAPAWDRGEARCSATYCHGANLGAGGTNHAPVWTGGVGEATCGTCHEAPPPPPHPAATACHTCHPGTVDEHETLIVANHVNGHLEVERYHPEGWRARTSHGYAANRDLASCKACHGADLTGGTVGISCDTCHDLVVDDWRTDCTFCHGTPNRATNAAAPPVGTEGEVSTLEAAVGAHQAHLVAGNVAKPIACTECHVVPTDISHVTGTVDFRFGTLASAHGAEPAYAAGTCASTYCHGTTLDAGGGVTEPVWTLVDASQRACGACHGAPPPEPHPQLTECRTCHADTVLSDAGDVHVIDVNGGFHVDGTVQRTDYHPEGWEARTEHGYAANRDLASCKRCHGDSFAGGLVGVSCNDCHASHGFASWQTNCTFCHGDRVANTPAPPVGTEGETAYGQRAVGAHAAHLSGARLGTPVACSECHGATLPTNVDHVNGTVLLGWGGLATAHSAGASWSAADATCTNYCHGATLPGGGARPVWTGADQAACGSCHGVPPPSPHPAVISDPTACRACHRDTVALDGSIIPASSGGKHLSGDVDVSGHDADWMTSTSPGFHAYAANEGLGPCQSCHGTDLSAIAKGDCTRCHGKGVAPDLATCTGCHGGTYDTTGAPPRTRWGAHGDPLREGAHRMHASPTIASSFGCAPCHAVPADAFAANHLGASPAEVAFTGLAQGNMSVPGTWDRTAPTCAVYCHGATLAGGSNTDPDWTRIGVGEAACGTCHGVPPPAPHPSAAPGSCGQCHPATMDAGGNLIVESHVNGHLEVQGYHPDLWALRTNHGYAANRDLASCKACHGATLTGGIVGVSCDTCHDRLVEDWRTDCTFCHGTAGRANPAAPPVGTEGEVSTLQAAVGAHQAHLAAGNVSKPVACGECHVVPSDISHVTSTVEMRFGTLATANGTTTPVYAGGTCAAAYCHGATLDAGGAITEPTWTLVDGSQRACGACHGAPPPAPHPQLTECKVCHEDTVLSDAGGVHVIDVAGGFHVDGTVQRTDYHPAGWRERTAHGYAANRDLASCKPCHGDDFAGGLVNVSCNACHASHGFATWQTSCTFCHGDRAANTPAPPVGTEGEALATERAVGAHAAHLSGVQLGTPVACSECHGATLPANVDHVNGTVLLGWGGLATAHSAAASWSAADATCTNYCHGATLPGGGARPVWTGADQGACGSCHGVPPPSPHPVVASEPAACFACHGDTVDPSGAIIPASSGGKHLSGDVEVKGHDAGWKDPESPAFHAYAANEGLGACQTCHGTDLGAIASGTCTNCHGGTGPAPDLATCTGCHGGTYDSSGAPPRTRWGAGADPLRIGSHHAHLATAIAPAFGCAPCHAIPGDAFAPGHLGASPAEVAFTGLAVEGLSLAPTWDRGAPTCAVYCHGATLSGGTNTDPDWTRPGAGEAACGTCHGLPPLPPHPATASDPRVCNACHPDSVSAAGTIIPPASGGLHLDGAVEQSGGHDADWMIRTSPGFHAYSANQGLFGCQVCHGQKLDGAGGVTYGCDHCHGTTPTGPPALSCTGCHGGTDNTTGAPARTTWGNTGDAVRVGAHTTHVSASDIAPDFGCDVCHPTVTDVFTPGHITTATSATVAFTGLAAAGMSPPTWDRTSPTCAVYCHGATLGGGTNSTPTWSPVGSGQAACGTCHGLPPGDPHPPVTGLLTGCAECHPETVDLAGAVIPPADGGKHLNGLVDGGHAPSWMDTSSPGFHAYAADRGLTNCQICHGPALDGVGGSTTVGCGDCHRPDDGRPPPEGPPLTCTGCHGGGDNLTGAPPKVTWPYRYDPALVSIAPVKIGAHSSHVGTNPVSGPIGCAECHPNPADMLAAGHIDGDVTVVFAGPVSGLKGGRWNGTATPTCSSTYCHGNFVAGKTANTPSWTGVNQAACGTCHNARPQGYLHRRHQDTNFNLSWWTGWVTCDQCHDGIARSTSRTDAPTLTQVNGGGSPLHVNGEKTVVFKAGGTWDPQPFEGTCSNMQCHPGETKVWPR